MSTVIPLGRKRLDDAILETAMGRAVSSKKHRAFCCFLITAKANVSICSPERVSEK